MTTKKPLSDLNLMDRFLFSEAMEDPVILKTILDILLGEDITLKFPPQPEKEQRVSSLKRFVKLDVWAWDIKDVIYDTEVQKKNTQNIPKRSRLYQSFIDTKLLKPGEVDFNALNKVYVIMIMPFDLFGYGLYQYTFEQRCLEIPDLSLGDDATRIFFNTHGTNAGDVNPELIELLRYIEHTTEEVIQSCTSERIRKLHERIRLIKSNEEIGVKYMQEWEERVIEKKEARQEGLEEGLAQGQEQINQLYEKLLKAGRSDDVLRAIQDKEYLETLFQEFQL